MTNLVIITADDLSYGSIGCEGCNLTNITPNIDNFSKESYHFNNAHTTVGLCQPARSVLMSGLYPWNNGALGFNDVFDHIYTLPEVLKNQGYRTGIIGKVSHLSPIVKFNWDEANIGWCAMTCPPTLKEKYKYYEPHQRNFEFGKNPILCAHYMDQFISNSGDKPFFLLVNSHDPHRPFRKESMYDVKDIIVPPFLNDTQKTRFELSQYYTSVNQFDVMVGYALEILKKHNKDQDTLVVLTTDHGMSFPFVKANCYAFSTRIPLFFKLPGVIPHNNDHEHYVSGIDLMPTVLDLLGIKSNIQFDGSSYADIFRGIEQKRDFVYTCLVRIHYGQMFCQTRSIHTNQWCYINNLWSDSKKHFSEDGCFGNQDAFNALTPKRRNYLNYRVPEEFFDLSNDYYGLNNLIDKQEIFKEIKNMKDMMLKEARRSQDHILINAINFKKYNQIKIF